MVDPDRGNRSALRQNSSRCHGRVLKVISFLSPSASLPTSSIPTPPSSETSVRPATTTQINRFLGQIESYVRGLKAEDFAPSSGLGCGETYHDDAVTIRFTAVGAALILSSLSVSSPWYCDLHSVNMDRARFQKITTDLLLTRVDDHLRPGLPVASAPSLS
jgi:hypothetical protein